MHGAAAGPGGIAGGNGADSRAGEAGGLPAGRGQVPSRGANIERKTGSCFARKRREREVGTSIVEVQSYD